MALCTYTIINNICKGEKYLIKILMILCDEL